MKRIYSFWLILMVASIFSSCDDILDDLDTLALTDFAPGFLEVYPGNNSKVVKGNFNLSAHFVDGTVSPLASASIKLMDPSGTEITSATKSLSGTADSIVVEGSSFNAESLEVGVYTMEVSSTDSKGQTATQTITFEISNLPFPANFEAMYLAGPYNGWGADAFELTGPNTWTLKEVMLDGGEWKLKNCADWCDRDWADADGDGVLEETTGGGPNSASSPVGLYNVVLNDQALTIRFEPAVTFSQNVDALYLLGNFNNFSGGGEYKFSLVADNTWELPEVELSGDALFKFSEGANFEGVSYGDNEGDGIAEAYGSNISLPEGSQGAFYKVSFNDATLAYTLEFLRFPSIGIIGSATPGGWDNDTNLTDNGNGTFSALMALNAGEAKFRANDSWDVNWGGTDFPAGTGESNSPNNIPIAEGGTYLIVFNPSTGEYSFTKTGIEIIGDATSGGWNDGTDLVEDPANPGSYSLTVTLTDGSAKFRMNDSWDYNWGGTEFPSGTGVFNGPDNIPVTAGEYTITFDVNTGAYSFD